jgi:BirA family biotin operon repressor/biotin-[acetyl-CoA-carboxylase] ligase
MQIIRRGEVVSTMDECRALYASGVREITAVSADAQTGGRGRVGRSWFSPAGAAVYLSVLLPYAIDARLANRYTMLGALAVVEAITPFVRPGTRVSIKWPNDVLLNGRKVAGVLVESSLLGEFTEYSVLGIGVNVNVDFADAPDDVRARACSLHEVAAGSVSRDDVLLRLADMVERRSVRFLDAPQEILAEYRAHLATIGAVVSVVIDGRQLDGRALRVEDDGALVVQAGGEEHVVRYGDLRNDGTFETKETYPAS